MNTDNFLAYKCINIRICLHSSRVLHIISNPNNDEEAEKNWINNNIETLNKYNADGVFGPVLPLFHDRTTGWIKEGNFFTKDCPPTGDTAVYTRTSNCIIKAELIKSEPCPFDPAYGITGGEDTHLFTRLKRKGISK